MRFKTLDLNFIGIQKLCKNIFLKKSYSQLSLDKFGQNHDYSIHRLVNLTNFDNTQLSVTFSLKNIFLKFSIPWKIQI